MLNVRHSLVESARHTGFFLSGLALEVARGDSAIKATTLCPHTSLAPDNVC